MLELMQRMIEQESLFGAICEMGLETRIPKVRQHKHRVYGDFFITSTSSNNISLLVWSQTFSHLAQQDSALAGGGQNVLQSSRLLFNFGFTQESLHTTIRQLWRGDGLNHDPKHY